MIEVAVHGCSLKQAILILFRNIHKKTPVLESLFNKVALKFFIKKGPKDSYFSVNIAKSLRTPVAVFKLTLLDTLND